jgi:DNA repair protein RadD
MMSFVPRQYQIDCVQAAWDFLCSRRDDPVLVLPTGAGKSWIIAALCRDAVERFDGRVIVLAHRKELLEQNAEKIRALIPGLEVGIYSAGLKKRDTDHRILVAGIQSVFDKAHLIGLRQLCIIDESHLVADEGMYRTFLEDLKRFVPFVRRVGLTATPYRLDVGTLCGPDRLFARVAYKADVRELMNQGFLCPITTTPSLVKYDTDKLHVRGGEFVPSEMNELFGDTAKVKAACQEIVAMTTDRHSVLIFCSGVQHAGNVANEIARLTGELVGCVTGETDPITRGATLHEFKAGRLKYVVNCDVLTTGFDAPNIDAIVILRATKSPGLLAQICGRGFRPHESKTDCLILDFGGNFRRHGPLDDPAYGVESSGSAQDSPGEVPLKLCPNCKEECHAAVNTCPGCGFAFPPRELKHDTKPDETAPLVEPTTWTVLSWSMARHVGKKSQKEMLKVDYLVKRPLGNMTEAVNEYICIAHDGYAQNKARQWWSQHTRALFTSDIKEALSLFDADAFARPSEITTVPDGQWTRVTDRKLGPLPEFSQGDAYEPPVDEWTVNDPAPPIHDEAEVPF